MKCPARVIMIFFVCCFYLQSCASRSLGSAYKHASALNTDSQFNFDINDVSILFPPPLASIRLSALQNMHEVGYWPDLVGSQGFIEKSIFDEIMDLTKGNPERKVLSLGIDYRMQTQTESGETLAVDASEQERWRVVSFRVIACNHDQNGRWSESLNKDSFALPKRCQPEFRIVAQPFLGMKSAVERRLAKRLPLLKYGLRGIASDPGGWYAADYGLHFFYRLTPEQLKSVVGALNSLKNQFSAECSTDGMPLSVHPCLLKQIDAAGNGSKEVFAYGLSQFFRTLPFDKLYRVAIWGSRNGAGPWSFMHADIRTGSPYPGALNPRLIPTIAAQAPDRLSKPNGDLSSETLWTEGKAMMVSIGSALSIKTSSNQKPFRGIPTRGGGINPLPNDSADALTSFLSNDFNFFGADYFDQSTVQEKRFEKIETAAARYPGFLKEFGLKGASKIEVTGQMQSDLTQLTSRIESPDANTEFTVDCGSCHTAHVWGALARGEFNPAKFPNFPNGIAPEVQAERLTQSMPTWIWNSQNFEYDSPNGIAAHTLRPYFRTGRSFRRDVYVFNQFSYYKDSPLISMRVVNESAQAAYQINKFVFGHEPFVKDDCFKPALRFCQTSFAVPDELTQGLDDTSKATEWKTYTEKFARYCYEPQFGICKQREAGSEIFFKDELYTEKETQQRIERVMLANSALPVLESMKIFGQETLSPKDLSDDKLNDLANRYAKAQTSWSPQVVAQTFKGCWNLTTAESLFAEPDANTSISKPRLFIDDSAAVTLMVSMLKKSENNKNFGSTYFFGELLRKSANELGLILSFKDGAFVSREKEQNERGSTWPQVFDYINVLKKQGDLPPDRKYLLQNQIAGKLFMLSLDRVLWITDEQIGAGPRTGASGKASAQARALNRAMFMMRCLR